jgi:hypothetical protein
MNWRTLIYTFVLFCPNIALAVKPAGAAVNAPAVPTILVCVAILGLGLYQLFFRR